MVGRKFVYETVVRETQLDSFGHLNHAHYLGMFEDARWELITGNGYGLEKIRQTRLGPTILEARIRYKRELRARQKIRIETQCVSYERKIGRLVQKMINAEGEECCVAEFVIGLFDVDARKLVLPTADWKKAVGV